MLPSLLPVAFFQQQGALSHYNREVLVLLDETLTDLWNGRGDPTYWPARSPDLTLFVFL